MDQEDGHNLSFFLESVLFLTPSPMRSGFSLHQRIISFLAGKNKKNGKKNGDTISICEFLGVLKVIKRRPGQMRKKREFCLVNTRS